MAGERCWGSWWARAGGGVALALGVAGVAVAGPTNSDAWQTSVTVYGYFPSVRGGTTFPNGSGGPSFEIDAHDIVSNLKFAAMGSVQFHKGPWGGLIDVFYANVSDSRQGSHDFTVPQVPVPVGVSANLKLGTRTTLVTMAATWQFVAESDLSVRTLAGVRMNDTRQHLDWALSAPLVGYPQVSGKSKVDHTDWDAIIGLEGRQRFGPDLRWYVPFYIDVGTGTSRFTGQALTGIGYAFGWGDVTATWRYLDYDFKSSRLIRRTSYSGPAVGVTWRF